MNSVEDTAQTMFATQTVKGVVQQATSIIINKRFTETTEKIIML